MSPILPSTGMQVEARREQHAPANENEYAQKYGRVLKQFPQPQRASARSRPVLLVAAVVITLAVLLLI